MKPSVVFSDVDRLIFGGQSVSTRDDVYSVPAGVYYYTGGNCRFLLESLMGEKDSAHTSRNGSFFTFRRGRKAAVYCVPSTAIGFSGGNLGHYIQFLDDAIRSEGLEWGKTFGSIAGRFVKNPPYSGLDLQSKGFFKQAIYQGPQYCASAYSSFATAIDRKQAFLEALNTPLPTKPFLWSAPKKSEYKYILDMEGVVEATVFVHARNHYGVLPVDIGTQVLPLGLISGIWPINLLRYALENCGVTLEEDCITRAIVFTESNDSFLRYAYESVSKIKEKKLRKGIYTRLWGMFARDGGIDGFTAQRPELADYRCYPLLDTKLFWYQKPVVDTPVYRPDISCWIAAQNACAMLKKQHELHSLQNMEERPIVAAHVDCFWVNGSPKIDETWSVKDQGELRFWAPGTYRHQKTAGSMLPRDSVDTTRVWRGDPWRDTGAWSEPLNFSYTDTLTR